MKVFTIVIKAIIALAAVAGAIYLAATYGDKIVAWAKKMLGACKCHCEDGCCGECTCEQEDIVAEEAAPVEEAAEEVAEEPEVEIEVVVAEGEPVAEETDFAE